MEDSVIFKTMERKSKILISGSLCYEVLYDDHKILFSYFNLCLEKPVVREFYHGGTLDGVVWQCQDVKLKCEMASNHSLRIQNYRLYQNERLIMKQRNSGVFRISSVGLEHSGTYACVAETRLGLGRNKTLKLYVKGEIIKTVLKKSHAQKSHSLSTRCARTACSQLLTSLEQVVIIL